ncbi:T-cell surface protein tactile isoform X2 [Apodemus sylvaticus]|uniref:T-cell surface protein tactile isoform X2 n=1 Tax=Apodemus sylvaticus TaxID=10129 RepID=UPI002243710F|nr:T-cell surface protein tactile isoform X2 [Apodemus sylvaticus]
MGRKWTYCVVYAIIQIQFFRGVWEELFNAGDNVYALPGSDVNLTCQTKEKDFLVQMQWSRVTDKTDMIALYHPQYGFHCRQGHACDSQVAVIETPKGVTNWTLYLRNISSTLSGKYECSFTLYPEGIKTIVYNLIVEPYTQDERNHTIEIETNRTLEIPCFQNASSETSPRFTFSWLVEEDGREEVLFTHNHQVSHSTSFKGRVKLGADYGLYLSPVQIQDDGRTFSCHLSASPLKVWKTSTTVKVFAKPEIFMTVENSTMDVVGERVFTCLLKNVFPKANITWLIDGRFLQGNEEGIYITNEEKNASSGFRELKSVFRRMHNRASQSNNVTVWCMALSPGPRNKTWYTSSQPITFSLVLDGWRPSVVGKAWHVGRNGKLTAHTKATHRTQRLGWSWRIRKHNSVTVPVKGLSNVTGSTLGAQPFQDVKVSPTNSVTVPVKGLPNVTGSTLGEQPFPEAKVSSTRYLVTSTSLVTIVDENVLTPDAPPQTVSWMPSEVHTSVPSDASIAPHDSIISTTNEFPDVLTTANGTTKSDQGPITSIIVNKGRGGMSWPVIVTALLFFCTLLFGLGVRKWCQYQKEIMERPPPFKPPPPPIKYTCIQEPRGRDLPCHEMEVL